jgi:hypothetical protein
VMMAGPARGAGGEASVGKPSRQRVTQARTQRCQVYTNYIPRVSVAIHDILVWIRNRIRGSMPLTNGLILLFFVIDLPDASKKIFFIYFIFLLISF